MHFNTRSIDTADETEFRGQARSQSGDWEREGMSLPRRHEGTKIWRNKGTPIFKKPVFPEFLSSRFSFLQDFLRAFAPSCLRVSLAFVLFLMAFVCTARAEDASVTATLSSASVAVGEAVELQITIKGTQKAPAPQPRVDGLDFQYNGASTQVQMNNFDISRSVVHTYTVLPQKEGTFTIPALSIDAGGKKLATQPLTLTVARQSGGGQAGTAGASENNFAAAEWVLPKTTAYVGEAIPAELRLYVLSQIRWELPQLPALSGEGFTIQKMPKPTVTKATKDGREYDVAIFKTAITPAKAGKLVLPASDLNTVMVLPQKRSQRPRFPGFPDAFNDQFFNGAFNSPQQVVVRPESIELEIKPLPVAGRPASFAGAVGQFTMAPIQASPAKLRVGDPVTITAVVKGIGSFDRMNAPTIAEEEGWKLYPPSGKFKANDEVGISGEKTFEIAAIPESAKTELPKIEFSFFNPSTEKYETITAKRFPLTVEGAPVSSPTPNAIAASPTSASPTPAATPKPNDIQYIRVDSGTWGLGFEPVWNTHNFWLAQLLPFSALLLLGGWQWRRERLNDATARRATQLRQSKAEALRVLRDEKTTATDFYNTAIRTFQIETALGQLRVELDPGTIDAEAACASRPLDCETAEGIRHIFAAHDQLRYAGVGAGGSSSEPVYPDQRERVLQILEQFEKSHA